MLATVSTPAGQRDAERKRGKLGIRESVQTPTENSHLSRATFAASRKAFPDPTAVRRDLEKGTNDKRDRRVDRYNGGWKKKETKNTG